MQENERPVESPLRPGEPIPLKAETIVDGKIVEVPLPEGVLGGTLSLDDLPLTAGAAHMAEPGPVQAVSDEDPADVDTKWRDITPVHVDGILLVKNENYAYVRGGAYVRLKRGDDLLRQMIGQV